VVRVLRNPKVTCSSKIHKVKERSPEDRPLVYNRINKAGSSSLLGLFTQLAIPNKFVVVSRGLPKVRSLSKCQEFQLAKILCRPGPRILLSRHLYFVDFASYGCPVININQVRDPVARFVSRFHFHRRRLAAKRPGEQLVGTVAKQLEMSLEDCVRQKHPECSYQVTFIQYLFCQYEKILHQHNILPT